jgi:hypothetical protein
MNLSFAESVVELRSWGSKSEMLDYLARCDGGSLLLGEDAEREEEFYSATVHLNRATAPAGGGEPGGKRFGVGVCSEGGGVSPHLLLLPEKQLLVFGLNAEVAGVSVAGRRLLFRTTFDHLPFRSFVHARRRGLILAFHEIGVVALTEEGEEVWRYDKDVITECVVDGDRLTMSFMDSPPVSLNLASGSVVTKTA